MTYEIGTKVFGDWEIVRKIGHGSYGYVYEAQKKGFGVTARSAVKLIRIPSSEKEVKEARSYGMNEKSITKRFRGFVDEMVKEVDAMQKLSGHPNIVGCQDYAVTEHREGIGWDILIRMELLEPLIDYLLRNNKIPEEKVIQLGIDMSNALMICHEKGIIHRDVKPDNIFVDAAGKLQTGRLWRCQGYGENDRRPFKKKELKATWPLRSISEGHMERR